MGDFMGKSQGIKANAFAQQKFNITGSTLKILAIVTMLIDHTGYVLVTHNFYLNFIMRSIGRIAFPIFVFLLIEGATHTSSKFKYALRLSLFAILSEIPFDLAFHKELFYFGYQNVFFTLAIGMFMIIVFESVSKISFSNFFIYVFSFLGFLSPTAFLMLFYRKAILYQIRLLFKNININSVIFYFILIIAFLLFTSFYFLFKKNSHGFLAAQKACINLGVLTLALFLVYILKTDYSELGILTITAMYTLRSKKTQSFFLGCLVLIFFMPFEIPALLGLLPVSQYNGARGLKLKYAFYIFYPSHLLILYFISFLINKG